MSALGNPALVLNADFRPLSYYPLSLCSWQDAIKSVFLKRVSIIESYEQEVHSPTITLKLPSVIALKDYVMLKRQPAFTRFNVFLRDNFTCQYCKNTKKKLTIDHIIPKSRNGNHSWNNVTTACTDCNHKKAGKTPEEAKMRLIKKPSIPNLNTHILKYSNNIQTSWSPFLFK